MTVAAGRIWLPYCGAAPEPVGWLIRWNFDPVVLSGLLLLAFAVARSERRAAGASAVGLLVLLFVSPFCALTSALFAARVTHHLVLTAIVAPLIVLAFGVRLRIVPNSIAVWTGLQTVAFWAWHAPLPYEAALSHDLVYWAMQGSLIGTAIGFWLALSRCQALPAVTALLATTVQMGLLGALITFSGAPLYAPHYLSTIPWGFTPLEDQQLAGLIMWAPAAALYLAAALLVAHRWLAREQSAITA